MSDILSGQLPSRAACPSCGLLIDAFTGHSERPPEAGDLSICAYCGAGLVYTQPGQDAPAGALGLRLMSRAEREALEPDTRQLFERMQRAIETRLRSIN